MLEQFHHVRNRSTVSMTLLFTDETQISVLNVVLGS